jgi:hypothetical protein
VVDHGVVQINPVREIKRPELDPAEGKNRGIPAVAGKCHRYRMIARQRPITAVLFGQAAPADKPAAAAVSFIEAVPLSS